MSKDHLFVVKDNGLILQGTHNKRDGLWDIPVKKHTLKSDNYLPPTTHAALYTSISPSYQTTLQPPPTKKKSIKQDTSIKKLGVESLIDTNVCNSLVDAQMKKDVTYTKTLIQHKMVVVL